jgi:hypothetical protein
LERVANPPEHPPPLIIEVFGDYGQGPQMIDRWTWDASKQKYEMVRCSDVEK